MGYREKLLPSGEIFTKEMRSYVMSRIRSSGNQTTELRVLALLKQNGIRGWRRRYRLQGNPDFVFPRQRLAVFVDGCFWHGCPKCRNAPASNRDYWSEKNRKNRARDRLVTRRLRKAGWTVIRLWEHSLAKPRNALLRITRVIDEQTSSA